MRNLIDLQQCVRPTHRRGGIPSVALLAGILTLITGMSDVGADPGADIIRVGAFAQATPGGRLPTGWQLVKISDVVPSQFSLVNSDGSTVVRIDAGDSAASISRTLQVDPAMYPYLRWRWRISNLVAKANIHRKQGDDFPARLYVLFDYPTDRLSLADRVKLVIARAVYGDRVPAAALCYVWDGSSKTGTTVWSAYTDRVRLIVVRGQGEPVGHWVDEERNLVDDFQAAFGERPPEISGVAIAADTDQTAETVTSWFGDIWLSAQPGGAGDR
ncbi:MAG: DUF3047 domain-containing protein [Chromatiaceae bacterium]